MPASRPLLRRVPPRNELLEIDLDKRQEEGSGPREGGLEVARRLIGANAPVEFAAPEESGGQFGVVLSGSIVKDGRAYPLWSCAFAGAGESDAGLRAGPDGAEVLLLRFPVPLPEEAA